MPLRTTSLATALLLACLGTTAQAHQVWIEQSANQARVHFGEYADNLRETSPGLLDKFTGVPALELQSAGGKAQRVPGERTATAFTYALPGATADTLFAEAPYPLIDRSKGGKPALLWRPAAGWPAWASPWPPPHRWTWCPRAAPANCGWSSTASRCPRPRSRWSHPPAGPVRP